MVGEMDFEEVEDMEQMKKEFKGYRYQNGLVRMNPENWTMLKRTAELLPTYSKMEVRPSDVWVASYPKTGTTWTQELVWQVANNVDIEGGKVVLNQRFPFLEHESLIDVPLKIQGVWGRLSAMFFHATQWWSRVRWNKPRSWLVHNNFADRLGAESKEKKRFIKTHLPFSLLPPSLVDTAKVIYVARNPHDVMVSYYHHHRLFKGLGYVGTLGDFANRFMNNQLMFGPFFSHIDEGWSFKDHPNVLFIFYEEMKKDLKSVIGKVSKFLNKPLSDEQVETLQNHLDINNFRNNPAVNNEDLKTMGLLEKEGSFIRKGEVGGWIKEFGKFPGLEQSFNRWVEDNITKCNAAFPSMKIETASK